VYTYKYKIVVCVLDSFFFTLNNEKSDDRTVLPRWNLRKHNRLTQFRQLNPSNRLKIRLSIVLIELIETQGHRCHRLVFVYIK